MRRGLVDESGTCRCGEHVTNHDCGAVFFSFSPQLDRSVRFLPVHETDRLLWARLCYGVRFPLPVCFVIFSCIIRSPPLNSSEFNSLALPWMLHDLKTGLGINDCRCTTHMLESLSSSSSFLFTPFCVFSSLCEAVARGSGPERPCGINPF